MTKDTLLLVCGGLVVLLPFLGFPNQWDTAIMVVLGASIIAIGIVIRRDKPAAHEQLSVHSEPTTESPIVHEGN